MDAYTLYLKRRNEVEALAKTVAQAILNGSQADRANACRPLIEKVNEDREYLWFPALVATADAIKEAKK